MNRPLWSVQIELTNHCNYRCGFCPQSIYKNPAYSEAPFDRQKGYMEFALFKRAFDQAREFANEVNFSFFGEPTLHPEYNRIFRYMMQNRGHLSIVTNSNLSYLTKNVMELWIDVGINQCRFSIDAAEPDTYDLVRPGGHILRLDGKPDKVRRRLHTIDAKVMYWHDLSNHCPTRHVYVVCEKNIAEVDKYAKKWQPQLNSRDEIVFKNVLSYGGVLHKDTPGFDQMCHTNQCNVWEQASLTIDWQGNVTPCNLDVNMGLTIGNIKEKSLGELYKSAEWHRIRRLSQAREISPCRTCLDANNWTNNVVIRKGDKWNAKAIDISRTRPKYIPRLSVGK